MLNVNVMTLSFAKNLGVGWVQAEMGRGLKKLFSNLWKSQEVPKYRMITSKQNLEIGED